MSALRQNVDAALPIDRARFDERIFGLASVSAAIHAQRAADTAWNPAHERQSGDPGFLRRARDLDVGYSSTGPHIEAINDDFVEAAAQSDHDARNAAVAHDQIGAETHDGDCDLARKVRQEIAEVGFVLWHEQNLCGSANAKPGQLRDRLIAQQAAAQFRHLRFQIGTDIGKAHAGAPATASSHAESTFCPTSRNAVRVFAPQDSSWSSRDRVITRDHLESAASSSGSA